MTTDEIMDFADCYSNSPFIEGSEDDIRYRRKTRSALLKAVEEMARDAARYCWLREQNATLPYGFYVGFESDDTAPDDILWVGSDLDSVIDAAMKEAA